MDGEPNNSTGAFVIAGLERGLVQATRRQGLRPASGVHVWSVRTQETARALWGV